MIDGGGECRDGDGNLQSRDAASECTRFEIDEYPIRIGEESRPNYLYQLDDLNIQRGLWPGKERGDREKRVEVNIILIEYVGEEGRIPLNSLARMCQLYLPSYLTYFYLKRLAAFLFSESGNRRINIPRFSDEIIK